MKNPSLPKTSLPFILVFLRPYWKYCFAILMIGAVWSLELCLRPYLSKVMLDRLAEATTKDNLFYLLALPVATYIGLAFFISFLFRLYDYVFLKFLPCFNQDVILAMVNYTEQHSHSFFQNNFGGSIANKISETANSAEKIVEAIIDRFFPRTLALIFACCTMATVHFHLALILVIWAVLFIFCSYLFSQKPHELSIELAESQTRLMGKIIDTIHNMLTVRLFARQKYEYSYIAREVLRKTEKSQELDWSFLKRNAVMQTVANILVAALLSYLIYARQRGLVTIGDFALILTLSISIIDTLWDLSRELLDFSEDLGKCAANLSLITAPLEIVDDPEAKPLNVEKGEIQYKGVSFAYEKAKLIFNDLSVTIPATQKVGLVGYSGEGKTTFVNLIVRLHEIQSGHILIDGQDISKVTQESLHETISFIPQDPLLFHRTILENIRYGKLEATEEEIVEAAVKANAHEFIKNLSEGYNTLVGERGLKLSGGQRQRIAIARAFLKNAKILALDEPTSALDSLTEHHIQESLKVLMVNKTVLLIAHRLSTVLHLDRILVFREGRIVEDGTHQQLLDKKGIYSGLWNRQTT